MSSARGNRPRAWVGLAVALALLAFSEIAVAVQPGSVPFVARKTQPRAEPQPGPMTPAP